MNKLLRPSVVGAIVMSVWSALAWMVLPMRGSVLQNLPSELVEGKEWKALLPSPGVYHFPGVPEKMDGMGWAMLQKQAQEGPVVSLAVIHPQGRELFSLSRLVVNMGLYIAGSWLLAMVVGATGWSGWMAGLVLGGFGVVATQMPDANWYGYPWSYTLAIVVEVMVGWLIVGAVVGKMVGNKKPR